MPRLPESESLGSPTITLFSASSATYALDLPALHADLAAAGIQDLQLPTSLHGARITLNVPAGARIQWGDGPSALSLTQVRQPTVIVPPEVDADALRDLILTHPAATSFDPALAGQLRSLDDWRTTLPVPVPPGWRSADAELDGTRGLLLSAPDRSASAVLWVRGITVYAFAGPLTPDVLLAAASSLQ